MRRGFTIIELLVVLSLVGVLAMLAAPTFLTMKKNVALRNESTIIVNALRTAQYRSIVSQDNYTHGVHFDTDRLTVYGNTWSNPVNPEVHLFSNGVVVTQGIGSDAVFSRLIGSSTPQVISIGYPGGTISTITISGAGAISNL